MTANNMWQIMTSEYGLVLFELQYVTEDYRVLKSVNKHDGEYHELKISPFKWNEMIDLGFVKKD
jgi:hypothetical protein